VRFGSPRLLLGFYNGVKDHRGSSSMATRVQIYGGNWYFTHTVPWYMCSDTGSITGHATQCVTPDRYRVTDWMSAQRGTTVALQRTNGGGVRLGDGKVQAKQVDTPTTCPALADSSDVSVRVSVRILHAWGLRARMHDRELIWSCRHAACSCPHDVTS